VNGAPPTIYDVAATAGVSIASVSRVLNGTGSPRADTRERVLRAVAELGFVPDGAARALSVKLKETVGVVYRRVPKATSAAVFAEEDENLQFADIINRGIEVAAQRSGFSLLISSVAAAGAELSAGPQWQGSYYGDGGASVIDALTSAGRPLPRAIVCANDLAAVGALHALARHGVEVPESVAVTGFDDIPVARRLRPALTTVRQPIQVLGGTAFELLESLVRNRQPEPRDVVLPTQLIRRESCGCPRERA
jgi:DNA-binding LacI/PurR family transcriptional regulator